MEGISTILAVQDHEARLVDQAIDLFLEAATGGDFASKKRVLRIKK